MTASLDMTATTVGYTDLTWPWRWSHATLLGELLSSGFKSDFTLCLGPTKEIVAVHKIFLQFVSPVLNSRLGKCSAAQLEIEDVDPAIFKLLLKYIYTGDSGMTIVEALPLLKMATDFEIVPLADQCAALLKSDITVENVLPLFQSAMEYAHGELIQSTLTFICKNGQKVLKLDNFANLRLECLIEIIQQDDLAVFDEFEVFEAVYRWGEAEQTRSQEPVELRNILFKALTHVRFPLMDAKQFALDIATKNVLDASELTSIFTGFYSTPEQRTIFSPSRFPSWPRAYIKLKDDLILSRAPQTSYYCSQRNPNPGECLMISCDATIALKGFTIPRALFWDGSTARNNFCTDLLRVDFVVKSGNRTKLDCLPLGSLVEGRHYEIKIDAPFVLSDLTYLTVKITGTFSYQQCYMTQNYNVQSGPLCSGKPYFDEIRTHAVDFETTNPNIANFNNFVASPESSKIGLTIQRRVGDWVPMAHGLIETLIFGPI